MLSMEPFLTAYDPSDLPGGSVDPLGFDRGYQWLADKILPGLTNVANKPRYFSALCAAIFVADPTLAAAATPRQRYQHRLDVVLRFERLWTLANVLASERAGDDSLSTMGIRGVRYLQSRTRHLRERGIGETNGDFRLLSRQMPYGAVGIYGSVADGLRFIDRDGLSLTPDLGAHLGEAFCKESSLPKIVADSSIDDRMISIGTLERWGARAHVSAATGDAESVCFREALELNAVRWRMVVELVRMPARDDEAELDRFRRISESIERRDDEPDLLEALRAIDRFENCYRLVSLCFNRMLWMCQTHPPFTINPTELDADRTLELATEQVPGAVAELRQSLDRARTDAFRSEIRRVDELVQFLSRASEHNRPSSLCSELIHRHTAVQRAKLAGGRPKMPWLEVANGRITPTLGRALRVDREPTAPNMVSPHAFRSLSADALVAAGRIA